MDKSKQSDTTSERMETLQQYVSDMIATEKHIRRTPARHYFSNYFSTGAEK